MAGYSLRRGKELSKGFRAEAKRLVNGDRMNETGVDLARFKPILQDDDEFFDGFPLTNQDGTRWFPSDPIRESFNSSIIIGIALPIDLLDLFRRGDGGE